MERTPLTATVHSYTATGELVAVGHAVECPPTGWEVTWWASTWGGHEAEWNGSVEVISMLPETDFVEVFYE